MQKLIPSLLLAATSLSHQSNGKSQAAMSTLIEQRDQVIASSTSPIAFETTGDENWPVWDRFLSVAGQRIYSLGNVCGTCEYLFERLGNAARGIDVGALTERLNAGLGQWDDDVIDPLAKLMPAKSYSVGLFSLCPRSVTPGSEDDYFAVEQKQNQFEIRGDVPAHDPKIAYYRIGHRPITFNKSGSLSSGMLFEFVVPMVPDSSLDPVCIRDYETSLTAGSRPTAVALSLLDVKGPYMGGIDHWCLTHFLLDGHHKMAAAALSRRPLTLVSFLDRDLSAASPAKIGAALELLQATDAETAAL